MPLAFVGGGTGSGLVVNSYRDYTNVVTVGGKRIDARVTLTALSGATVTAFDSTTNPYAQGDFFQPTLSISSAGGYATFRVDFFDEDGQPATLRNFYANTYDLDGANASASGRQFTDFSGFSSYALATGTKVVTQDLGGRTRFLTTVGGNLDYTPGADDFNTIRARVFYTAASSVTINLGDAGATGTAYFGIDFSLGYAFNNIVADATPPVVTAGQSLSYVENQAANARVATVAASDAIGVVGFRFSATNTQTSGDGYYTIDSGGEVRLTATGAAAGVAQNDYDIAPNSFVYAVQAGDAAGNWSTATNVTFNVTAAAPKITGPSGGAGAVNSAISVNENQTAVTTLAADRAVTWSITGGADAAKFTVSAAGVITFAAAPDFETPTDADTNNVYVLQVTATDGGGLTAVQTVSVTVLDLADNAPVITGPSGGAGAVNSAISVNENQTAVTTLTSDRAVTWSITGGDDSAKFTVSTAGVITFAAAPDFETPTDDDTDNVYVLQITATDGGGLTAVQTVSVTVLDLADNAPVITGPSGGAGAVSSAISVNENQTTVTTLAAGSPVTWSVTGGVDAALFTINPTTGALTFSTAPDFEAPNDTDTNNVYVVQVTATDASSLTAAQTITVTVLDVLEGPPVITGPSGGAGAATSAVSVNEEQTAVVTLTANRPVTWSITGGVDAGAFVIDASGAITFAAAPDYEAPADTDTNNVYVLEVTATDASSTSAVQTITVTVRDILDGSPAITGPSGGAGAGSSSVSVNEGQAAVTTFAANRPVTWAITGGPDASRFAVNAAGVITFLVAPNYEAPTDFDGDNVYILELTATDANNVTALQMVSVTVRDLDDTAPVIKDAQGGTGSTLTSISVNEGVVSVGGFTADEAATWSITGGADKAKFKIDPATGAVAFVSAPDFDSPADADGDNIYELEIAATDDVGNVSRLNFVVRVLDVDDAQPVITGPDGVAGAAGSTLAMQEGLTAVASFTANEAVTWSLGGGTEKALFAIDPKTGALTFVNAPNFEAPADSDRNNTYLVVVRATDSSGQHSDHALAVQIGDVDEVTPRVEAIAKELRSDLRNHAFRNLGDMLAFNEGLFRDTGDCIAMPRQGVLTPNMNLDEFHQGSSLDWAKNHCTDNFRVIVNAGAAIDHADGDWTHRGLGSVRVEKDVKEGLTLGLGLMGAFAKNDLPSFTDSSIKDRSLQLNGYVRADITERLRAGAFAGYGRAWYDFNLHQPEFDLSGKVVGRRQLYGAMLSGDVEIAKVLVTTDVILSRAVEDLGEAKLTGAAGGEVRDVQLGVGSVDMTRLSVPVTGEFHLWGQASAGWNTTLRLSPGLLCEDTSADASALTCGYQFGGRLIARKSKSGAAYIDYRLESVDELDRSLIGVGYADTFGRRRQIEWAIDVSGGLSADQPDSRAMFHLRARP